MDVYFDDSGLHIGSKTYKGECLNCDVMDIGADKFDTKIYHFPGGYTKSVHCSEKLFRVAGFQPLLKDTNKRENTQDDDEHNSRPREDNINRARSRLQQIILCNEWDYFVTITFDYSNLNSSSSLPLLLQKWLNYQTSKNNLGYVLVPEYHKKENRIHCHALVNGGLQVEHNDIWKVKDIKKPVKGETIKKYHISNDRILYPVYNVSNWKHGFSTAIEVYGNSARLANYVLKYMTKDVKKIFGKHYWCSKNIKLYPDVELLNIGRAQFDNVRNKEYWVRCLGKSFKYEDNFSEAIELMANSIASEKEVLKL